MSIERFTRWGPVHIYETIKFCRPPGKGGSFLGLIIRLKSEMQAGLLKQNVRSNMHWGTFAAVTFEQADCERILSASKENVAVIDSCPCAWHSWSYLHLTIAYFGWISNEEAIAINNSITSFRKEATYLELMLTGTLDYIGWKDEPEYLALEIAHANRLISLRKRFLSELQQAGIFAKQQSFRPHISVARIRWRLTNNLTRVSCSGKIAPKDLLLFESTHSANEITVPTVIYDTDKRT